MVNFGAIVVGHQLARADDHPPFAVTSAAQLHPETAPSPSIAAGLDLQTVGREAGAQSLRGIVGQPFGALSRLLIEAVAGRPDSLL